MDIHDALQSDPRYGLVKWFSTFLFKRKYIQTNFIQKSLTVGLHFYQNVIFLNMFQFVLAFLV